MDISEVIRILKSMDEKGLEKEEADQLIDMMVHILDRLQPQIKKHWARILLYGVKGTLQELKEHIGEAHEKKG